MHDILIILWKEWKEILIQRGSSRGGIISLLFIVLVLGILPPLQFGSAWVESPFVIFLALWIPIMLVSNVVSDSFAGERERHSLETLLASRLSDRGILFGKLAAAISYGWGIAILVIFIGLFVVNLVHNTEELLIYSATVSIGIILSSLLSAGLSAGIGILISLRASSVRQAQQTMGLGIMLLFFIPAIGVQALPRSFQQEIFEWILNFNSPDVFYPILGVIFILDLLLIAVALVRFQRYKLILD
jgi:ABC-2 type transport system permease protein